MASLIIAVISLALVAMVTAVNMNHGSAYALARNATQTESHLNLLKLETAIIRYFDAQRDEEGDILYPGDNVDLLPLVAPTYGFVPPATGGLGWAARTNPIYGMDAVELCVRPVVSELAKASVDSLTAIARQLPEGSAFLSNNCGATSTHADSAEHTHLTYWIVLLHIN